MAIHDTTTTTTLASHPATATANGANGTTTTTNGTKPPTDADLSALLHVQHGANYTTLARSLVTLPPNALFARLTLATSTPSPLYTTVQSGRDTHVSLNSDLVYINHSCAPNLIFDMSAMEVRVSDAGLREGEELAFFYPSTEWSMDRGFECGCGSEACVGWVGGAAGMDERVLGRYWVSSHVAEMKEEQGRERREKLAGGVRVGAGGPFAFRCVAG